jgi:hypothetical protein
MRATLLLWALVLGTSVASAPAASEMLEAGASGQCYNPAGSGGEDEMRVAVDTADPLTPAATAPSGTGAAAALVQVVLFPTGNGGCTDPPGSPSPDYLEAHASADGTMIQVCWDGASGGFGSVRVDGGCPTSPAPPGP